MIENKPKVIAITGHAGAGKDTAASAISSIYDRAYSLPFAAPLKEVCASLFNIPLEHFHSREKKELKNHMWGMSPREIAQMFGTEAMRNTFGTDFWIRVWNNKATTYNFANIIIVPDVRFQNELDFLSSKGAVVLRITRDGWDGNVGVPNHPSEDSLDYENCMRYSHIYNDSDLATFKVAVLNAVHSHISKE
jgi:hypothetical protein